MDARTLPPAFQTALALFNALRRLGFESENIFFCFNETKGFVVEVKHDGRQWGIRTGGLDMSFDTWKKRWKEVTDALADGSLTEESLEEIWNRFPFRVKLVEDLTRAGVRIPFKTRSGDPK
jgi:hypothetical protein